MFFILSILRLFFTIKIAANNARKENMSKIDFSKEKDYFRDILKNYSAAELSYIDDFKVNHRREIISTVLELQLKKKIKINNDSIELINSSEDGLRKTEKYVLNSFKDGKFYISNSGYIESYAQDEAIADGLVELNSEIEKKKRIKRKKIIFIIITIIYFFIFVFFSSNCERINELGGIANTIATIIGLLVIIAGMDLVIGLPLYFIVYILMQENSYHRTEKGEEINTKLEGLKKYIEDYSKLNEADREAIIIWDEFLIYSIIFGINKSGIENQIMKYVDIEFEYGKIYFSKN